jgi:4-diphosphocytidyl-2C-methyl-D-erythritol kinase
VDAQAKINLRLRVLALGDSGYHSIETVFQRLELADRITVSVSDGGALELDVFGDDSLVMASGPAEQNLALLAAGSYLQRADWHPRVHFRID